MTRLERALRAIGSFALLTATALPARAACYDVFGCSDRNAFRAADLRNGPTCEFLWVMRNTIYQERGYCFRTPRAIATLGNDGCRYRDLEAVPMSRIERANAATIAQVEREMGCPR